MHPADSVVLLLVHHVDVKLVYIISDKRNYIFVLDCSIFLLYVALYVIRRPVTVCFFVRLINLHFHYITLLRFSHYMPTLYVISCLHMESVVSAGETNTVISSFTLEH